MATGGPRYVPQVADGHEQWFIDESPKNRMVLALSSGIDEEIAWSLYRLSHLSHQHGQRFFLKPLHGLTDALFDWPLDYVENDGWPVEDRGEWSAPASTHKKRKHALESLLILRNSSLEPANSTFLLHEGNASRTYRLIAGLGSLSKTSANAEFILYLAELFQGLAPHITLPKNKIDKPTIPLRAMCELVEKATDRALIISLLSGLASLLTNHYNANNSVHMTTVAPALTAAIRYLPLTVDRPLLAASLDYLFAHVSHPPAAKAFLHHPLMTDTVKFLVDLLVLEQAVTPMVVPIGPPPPTVPQEPVLPLYELSPEELQTLMNTPEPQRCMDWMRQMYIYAPDAEEVQGSVWILYRDTFTPHADKVVGGLAQAADVIKKIMEVFPSASALVDPGPPMRYVVRGIKRRLQAGAFKCRWNRGACSSTPFENVEELATHVTTHTGAPGACQWATCAFGGTEPVAADRLKAHALTHLPVSYAQRKAPGQPDTVTLPLTPYPHPSATPTERPPPPPPVPQTLEYSAPAGTPPSSTSLSALLTLRVLFRASFPDSGPAPPIVSDETRFGFPMPPKLDGEIAALVQAKRDEGMEGGGGGESKGRRAFERVAVDLARLKMGEASLAGWVEEMVGAVDVVPYG